jgi:hypothetical protein
MSWEELFQEIDRDQPAPTGIDWAQAIREDREERERELEARTLRDFPPE